MKRHGNASSALILLTLLALAVIPLCSWAADKPKSPDRTGPDPLGALIMPELAGGAVLPAGYRGLYEQRFNRPSAMRDFVMTDANAWKLVKDAKVSALVLATQSQYKPAVRSPVNIALIADDVFSDFILEVDLIQTGKEYGHRDMCLFFGFQSPTNFYYAHIATAADQNAHNVFIVNGAPRTNIARETTQGVKWGLGVWHKVKLERKVADGSIKIYFDDMLKPIMVAEDKTFPSGYVGFGSFDDTGMVDNIKIWGASLSSKKTEFFSRPAISEK